jgi:hypothetical protein
MSGVVKLQNGLTMRRFSSSDLAQDLSANNSCLKYWNGAVNLLDCGASYIRGGYPRSPDPYGRLSLNWKAPLPPAEFFILSPTRMLPDEHYPLSQCEMLARPVRYGCIERRLSNCDATRRGDGPPDMLRVPLPQHDAEAHVGDVMRVRIRQLAQ